MGRTFKWLAVLGRLGNVYADQQLKEWKINSSHHMFLVRICNEPGITQDKLKSLLYIHPSNITRALEYLEREGYIIKETLAADKRTSRLYPTEKACQVYDYILGVTSEWEQRITSEMSEEEAESFQILLEKAGREATDYFFP